MPTYDYACRDCGNTIEVIHAMTADGPTVCERCGGSLRRVLYPAGIIFKGSGFYRTDSRATTNGSSSGESKESAGKGTGEAQKPSGSASADASAASGASPVKDATSSPSATSSSTD